MIKQEYVAYQKFVNTTIILLEMAYPFPDNGRILLKNGGVKI